MPGPWQAEEKPSWGPRVAAFSMKRQLGSRGKEGLPTQGALEPSVRMVSSPADDGVEVRTGPTLSGPGPGTKARQERGRKPASWLGGAVGRVVGGFRSVSA